MNRLWVQEISVWKCIWKSVVRLKDGFPPPLKFTFSYSDFSVYVLVLFLILAASLWLHWRLEKPWLGRNSNLNGFLYLVDELHLRYRLALNYAAFHQLLVTGKPQISVPALTMNTCRTRWGTLVIDLFKRWHLPQHLIQCFANSRLRKWWPSCISHFCPS